MLKVPACRLWFDWSVYWVLLSYNVINNEKWKPITQGQALKSEDSGVSGLITAHIISEKYLQKHFPHFLQWYFPIWKWHYLSNFIVWAHAFCTPLLVQNNAVHQFLSMNHQNSVFKYKHIDYVLLYYKIYSIIVYFIVFYHSMELVWNATSFHVFMFVSDDILENVM